MLLIGVRADRHVGTWQQDSVGAVAQAVRPGPVPYPVETTFLDDQTDPVTAWMLEHTEPLYQRPTAA